MPSPRVKARAEANNLHTKESVPLLLPGANQVPLWLALTVGMVLCLISGAQVVFHSPGVPAGAIAGVETLYVLALALIVLNRLAARRWLALAGMALAMALGFVLCLTFANLQGYFVFDLLPFVIVYRFAWRWSLPIMGLAAALLAGAITIRVLFIPGASGSLADIGGNVLTLAGLGCLAGILRSRSLVVLKLQATQAQLQVEMQHTAELAAARERTRIARDMHDVLAHSLTVLSIQAQAARQIVTQQPEQAAHLLDEMAEVLRESIAESRRVVGLLHEATYLPAEGGTLSSRLLALADRFAARTGLHCSLHTTGQACQLNEEQKNTLHLALQEALTNAYRHGGARHVWADLAWAADVVTLTVRDDGTGQPGIPLEGTGGNGLRGMRERATALGGSMRAGPHHDGGFEVSVSLPLMIVEAARAEVQG
jgi:signal transduction histidine kinase